MRGASSTRLFQICLFSCTTPQRSRPAACAHAAQHHQPRQGHGTLEVGDRRAVREGRAHGPRRLPASTARTSRRPSCRRAPGIARHFCTAGMIGCYLSHRNFGNRRLRRRRGRRCWRTTCRSVRTSARSSRSAWASSSHPETRGGNWTCCCWARSAACTAAQVQAQPYQRLRGRRARDSARDGALPRAAAAFRHARLRVGRRGAALLRRASLATGHVDAVAWASQTCSCSAATPCWPTSHGGALDHRGHHRRARGVAPQVQGGRVHGRNLRVGLQRALHPRARPRSRPHHRPASASASSGWPSASRSSSACPGCPLHVAICSAMFVFLRIMITPQPGEGPGRPPRRARRRLASGSGSRSNRINGGRWDCGRRRGERRRRRPRRRRRRGGWKRCSLRCGKRVDRVRGGRESVGEDDTAQVSPPSTPPSHFGRSTNDARGRRRLSSLSRLTRGTHA